MAVRNPGGTPGNESVTTAMLATGAVTERTIAAANVTAPKLNAPNQPATPAGENEIAGAFNSAIRCSITVLTGNNSETKFKIKHLLNNTRIACVTALKMTTKVATEPYLEAAGAGNYTWKILSATEVEVIFGTAPGAAAEVLIMILG